MDIIFASTNKGKIREFKEILAPYGINVISLADLDFKDDIVEDGNTFLENALIKAKTISKYYNKPAMSDDSGICVEALNGEPGIHSAKDITLIPYGASISLNSLIFPLFVDANIISILTT